MFAARLSLALALAPALIGPAAADDEVRCLSRDQQRAAIADGRAVPLASALRTQRRRVPGEVVRARLCQEGERLIYRLTVLARDGKVKRTTVDAASGALVDGR
jgi:uncharacterized membrane protein YkoI